MPSTRSYIVQPSFKSTQPTSPWTEVFQQSAQQTAQHAPRTGQNQQASQPANAKQPGTSSAPAEQQAAADAMRPIRDALSVIFQQD